jgi:hypothetical protein
MRSCTIRFLVVCYSGLLAGWLSFILLFILTVVQSNHCNVAVSMIQAGIVLVAASSGIIFGCRVSAIWNGNKIVHATVTFCMVVS